MFELRRKLLKGGSVAALLSPLLGTGLLMPTAVLAADWNRPAFGARNIGDALKAYGHPSTHGSSGCPKGRCRMR